MAQGDQIDAILKSLRLLPEFDGNPNTLTRFINLSDQLVGRFLNPNPGNELENQALLNGILNKVTGPAARFINSNGIPTDWMGIRTALINNFADQRDETALYNDLSLLTQGQSTPQEFFEKCQTLFSTIMTYVTLHDSLPTTVEAKRELYKKLTLQSYLRGLKEPLGSRIRCMRPVSIEKALEYVQEETNTLYLQQRNNNFLDNKKQPNVPAGSQIKPSINQPFTMTPINFSMPGPSRHPPMLVQQSWRPNDNNNSPQFNRGPTRTQQIFRALPPNYNDRNNAFRMIPRNVSGNMQSGPGPQRPAPMSGVSHFVSKPMPVRGHDWTKSGNPPPSNYFKSRELNLNECPYYAYGPYYDHSEYYYVDPEYNDNLVYFNDDNYNEQLIVSEVPNGTNEPLTESKPSTSNEDFRTDSKSDKQK